MRHEWTVKLRNINKNRRVISREEGEAFALERNLLFAETSAKKSINVDKAFKAVAENI